MSHAGSSRKQPRMHLHELRWREPVTLVSSENSRHACLRPQTTQLTLSCRRSAPGCTATQAPR